MQLTPRYDAPALVYEIDLGDVGAAVVRQRRRLGDLLADLDVEQWNAPSRCTAWSVKDVVAHLSGVNRFWAASFKGGLAGEPTRFLSNFDPVATPEQLIAGLRAEPATAVLDEYGQSVEAFAAVIDAIGPDDWARPAEAPPGHIALDAVALHALWDAWVHERDIALPLGIEPVVAEDEVVGCLRYAAALGPAFHANSGSTRSGVLEVIATHPTTAFEVHAGPTVVIRASSSCERAALLEGDAVALVEGLSLRTPLMHALPADDEWLIHGLDVVFDQAGEPR